ncbi:MAG: zinc ribbon domain-containing protein [Betaproteobacteria bacterium]|nr:zinc ribbon domain-containing protein [Betaproteobacteria bacterium]
MIGITRQQGTRAAGARVASRILIATLAILCVPAFAAAASSSAAPKGNPRLASLHMEIWPEYDRPAVLVILKGEIASDVGLPAAVSVRIPALSGGPSAVAVSATASGGLLNAPHEREDAGDHILVKFRTPERFFHVEFYDPLATRAPARSYTYVLPGDFAAERVDVIVQEPAASSNISVEPKLDASAAGPDGLRYRSGQLGALVPGKQLPIKISYTKTDARTSTEILPPKDRASSSPSDLPLAPGTAGSSDPSVWAVIASIGLPLILGAGAGYLLWRRRERASEAQSSSARACAKCGAKATSSDRFCSKCGAVLK